MSVDPWFIYKRRHGRFRAVPANWQGWSVFITVLILTGVVSRQVLWMTDGISFILRFVVLGAVILAGVGAMCLVAIRKGRPSP